VDLDSFSVWSSALALLILGLQVPAGILLLARLANGPRRPKPLQPMASLPENRGKVSIVVPTLNEVMRLSPCLAGLRAQGDEVRESLIVDSRSQDGTPDLVMAASLTDPRIRLITDGPLPPGWVGRPWALHTGWLHSHSQSEWFLGIDADTQPQPGLVAALLQAAEAQGWDLISLSPRFILKSAGEWWLQPALLLTLIYRFGPGGTTIPERVMANGQCFLMRRSLLAQLDGYSPAASSFCDDVTLARAAAATGARVAFLDGSQVLKVRMYEGMRETWQEWGRSLDLKDATTAAQKWGDWLFLVAVQGLPLPLSLIWGICCMSTPPTLPLLGALGFNLVLVLIRWGMQAAVAGSYDWQAASGSWAFWLSPLADPLAVLRIFLSSVQRPKQWRGRVYGEQDVSSVTTVPN
jgi:dolichol-phosphate mannosyltransferase